MRKRWLLLLLAVLFATALLMVERYTGELGISVGSVSNAEPDYYGQQLQHRRYDVSGRLQQTLLSQGSSHNPHTRQTHLEQPVILTRDDQQQTWRVSAADGYIGDGNSLIELAGGVLVDSQPTRANQQFLTISTERLMYSPDDTTAWSDVPVHLNSNSGNSDAGGMKLDLNRQRLELTGKVSTRYAKP
ncbi:LPS export ABC transporter periplasmic protein LptC [Parathalassolituus penaei]|uniref:Lipopolysaccharide export system protein LptC n=1 Tax=Parathalassolituus penaei TaxID=2997323 RepID=A0A9X3EDF5_9GAMM|nr:LPS export ABC transporter periplasmic protein LptC [Parathalassolituus penaei]MCY0965553.1 LPS export ABC transporter periplasmic protein LptC [Parathalassolituus penaei]